VNKQGFTFGLGALAVFLLAMVAFALFVTLVEIT
jgi:hypothetical protein